MNAISNCPRGISKDKMVAISAPYNFVPLSDYVHIPEWSRNVSHDRPFQDGFSGEIHYTLIAESPLLVGGEQERNGHDDRPNTEVRPFKLPDGHYAIPGSSLKGMLRSVVEIAGFGRMRMVDEQRPGLRDISGGYVSASYKDKLDGGKVKTGFLYKRGDGRIEIVPCRMKRLSHRNIEDTCKVSKPVFRQGATVAEKYRNWERICQKKGWNGDAVPFNVNGEFAELVGNSQNGHIKGGHEGFVVFTGQVSDSTKSKGKYKGKYKDFIFHDENPDQAIPVETPYWRDFLHIHADGEENSNRPWNGYWRDIFRRGGKVPVFYVKLNDVLRIGLAYMPKLAGDFTTTDCIAHVSPDHLKAPGQQNGYDFSDLLFGSISGSDQDDAIKGRVSMEMAIAEGGCEITTQPDTILNGPKPSYFPNYLQQAVDASTRKLKHSQYSTFMATAADPNPRVRGFKRYPVRGLDKTGVQRLNAEQRDNRKVQVRLHTLEQGARFRGRIVFHNLKREELGLLFWTLTWGGDGDLHHVLGMGKSFGFGRVRIDLDLDRSLIIPNDPASGDTGTEIHALVATTQSAFEQYMERIMKKHGGWRRSPQMIGLMAMADPHCAAGLPKGMDLRHMCLAPKDKKCEFSRAKQDALVLADYAVASKYEQRIEEREEALRRHKEAEQARRERQRAEEDRLRKQAEFDALPESGKQKVCLDKALQGIPQPVPKDRYSKLIGAINDYLRAAKNWPLNERRAAVDHVRAIYEKYAAWAQPGIKSAKKKKQKEKKERQLQELIKP